MTCVKPVSPLWGLGFIVYPTQAFRPGLRCFAPSALGYFGSTEVEPCYKAIFKTRPRNFHLPTYPLTKLPTYQVTHLPNYPLTKLPTYPLTKSLLVQRLLFCQDDF